jgi:hypothetical protein
MTRKVRLLVAVVAAAFLCGCATIAGGLVGTGVGIATGHPVSGALIGTGVGVMIDTVPRSSAPRS